MRFLTFWKLLLCSTGIRGAGRIIAFVNATRQDEISLVEDLREKLPSYMIPNKVIFTGDLPKNQNGKIDRKIVQSWKLDR